MIPGYLGQTVSADHQPPLYGDDLLRGQFYDAAPVPSIHIGRVIEVGSGIQMIRVNAQWIVAVMVDDLPLWDRPIRYFKSGAMGAVARAPEAKTAVSGSALAARPQVTPVTMDRNTAKDGALKRAISLFHRYLLELRSAMATYFFNLSLCHGQLP